MHLAPLHLPQTRLAQLLLCLIAVVVLHGCSSTKYVEKGDYLVQSSPKFKGDISVSSDVLESSVKTKANRRIVIPKAYLNAWTIGESILRDSSLLKQVYLKLDKDSSTLIGIADWLQNTVGEPPELIKPKQLDQDAKNIESTYFSEGYFHSSARWEVHPNKANPKKAKVEFHIQEGPAYRYQLVKYMSQDKDVRVLAKKTAVRSILRTCERYKESHLTEERDRLSKVFRDNGYYTFSPSSVSYIVDTSVVQTGPRDGCGGFDEDSTVYINLYVQLPDSIEKFFVEEIGVQIIQNTADTAELMLLKAENLTPEERDFFGISDRILDKNQKVFFRVPPRVLEILSLNTVAEQLKVKVGSLYDRERSIATQRRLRELGIFNRAVMRYERMDSTSNNLRLKIDLQLMQRYSFDIGLEAFQSEDIRLSNNLPGIGASLNLNKRNAFKHAERLGIGLLGNIRFYRPDPESNIQLFYEYGANVNVSFPRLLFFDRPIRRFFPVYSPITTIGTDFRSEQPVEFTRNTVNASLSYTWQHQYAIDDLAQPLWQSTFNALSVNVVDANLTPDFQAELDQLVDNDPTLAVLVAQDFSTRFNSNTGYRLTVSRRYNFAEARYLRQYGWFANFSVGIGGNIPYLVDLIGQTGLGDGSLSDHQISGRQNYGQFTKFSAEGRIKLPFGRQRLVGRTLIGIGLPYGANELVPFEYRYFIGGTNSVRGWQANTLGPGTLQRDFSGILTFGGHYKFEANIEYRFPIFSPVEGALFMDAGNVWFGRNTSLEDPQARLSRETLQLGLSGGAGLRLDFTFVIIRFDVAQQMYAPGLQRWLINDSRFIGGPFIQYNLALEYPF